MIEIELLAAMQDAVTQEDAEQAVRTLLLWAGDDPGREGLIDTPRRVARMYRELFAALRAPAPRMATFNRGDNDQMVLVENMRFASMCEHHLVPFVGRVDIGYLPQAKILGLSKFARLVDWVAAKPQIQERMTAQLADLVYGALEFDDAGDGGVVVVVRAEHMCMSVRGVRKPGHVTTTSAIRGDIDKMEFFELLNANGGR